MKSSLVRLSLLGGAMVCALPSAARAQNAEAAPAPSGPKQIVIPIGADGKPLAGGEGKSGGGGGVYHYGQVVDEEETEEAAVGPVPEVHQIRKGDTLWDLCSQYFGDPWQWPKVWSYNPQVSNPHWIYPGDSLRLLPQGVFGAAQPAVANAEVKTVSAAGEPLEVPMTPTRKYAVELRQSAFVEQAKLRTAGSLDGAVEAKELLSAGDEVFLSYNEDAPVTAGHKYSIYVPGSQVTKEGRVLGSYVRIVGTVQVTDVRKDKRAKGVIMDAFEEIERGAKVGPLQSKITTASMVPATTDAKGAIVALVKRGQLIGRGEVVFVDVGEKAGVAIGNRLFVVRRGDALIPRMRPGDTVGQNDGRFPARALGEIVIVDVGQEISMGLVTVSVEELGVGDTVLMQAEK